MSRISEKSLLTILIPCLRQRADYLRAALDSVLRQSSADWLVLCLIEPTTPKENREALLAYQEREPRLRIVECDGRGMGAALNRGLRESRTEFVTLLLSDDELEPNAVASVQKARRRWPDIDFFHSGRRLIGPHGEDWGRVQKVRKSFQLSDFWLRGSPVKHLMAWRRLASIEAGGFNEELAGHGVDDYDFPWRMAERGLNFQSLNSVL
ncbi:MAG: glycosyltransferase, partial [Candidatus Eremiobacteraeota bacterium]|nr:glycosyltransferase [Candidatus Eremiobacteraeota bacterium]